jgi:hypothetical protein
MEAVKSTQIASQQPLRGLVGSLCFFGGAGLRLQYFETVRCAWLEWQGTSGQAGSSQGTHVAL